MVIDGEKYKKSAIYVTDDLLNEKELAEIRFLKKVYPRLIIATTESLRIPDLKIKYLRLPKNKSTLKKFVSLWLKISFLFSRACKSESDQKFPLRNIYYKNKTLTFFINQIWKIKIKSGLNNFLPDYQAISFLPLKIIYKIQNYKKVKKRLHIINSLIVHHGELYPYIGYIYSTSQPVIAIIKSWDNPFYTQFYRNADAYIGWGSGMRSDISQIQNKVNVKYVSWGPKPFERFYGYVKSMVTYSHRSNVSDEIIIGYAAAYGDDEMLSFEIDMILGLSKQLSEINRPIKILVRPYPTVSINKYQKIKNLNNIEFMEIEGKSTNRGAYNNELIKFGGVEERAKFLSNCDVYLSMATSFTIESIIFGKPTLQLYVNRNDRKFLYEKLFFQRVDICDHILKYFLGNLEVVSNMREFVRAYDGGVNNKGGNALLDILGIAESQSNENKKIFEIRKLTNLIN